MKKIISLMLTLILVMGLFAFGGMNASAASSSMRFSSKEVEIGKEVTITININADEEMYAIEFSINYNPEILEFVSGDDCSGGAGVISVAAGGGGAKTASKKYTFKALKAGSCKISTANMGYVNVDTSIVSVPNQGANLTVKDKSLSANAKLKSLSLSVGKLSPSFSSGRESYTAKVGNDVTSCKIYATAEDSAAKVEVSGGSNLKVGANNCSVTVTAANGSQKVYKITITRASEDEEAAEKEKEEEAAKEKEALQTEIEGAKYSVAKTLEGATLPKGFTESKTQYNGYEVAIAVDKNNEFEVYYLVNEAGEIVAPYLYNAEANTFDRLQYLNQGEICYIFTAYPTDFEVPESLFATNIKIGDFDVSCYTESGDTPSEFFYLYCYNGSDYGYYRYDSVEKVLQRYPELLSMAAETEEEDNIEGGFIEKFKALTLNAKIVVVGIVLAILGILALIILFVVKLFYNRGEAEFVSNLDYTEDFDDIDYPAAFSIEHSKTFITDADDTDEVTDLGDEFQSEEEIESDYVTEEESEE